MNKIELSRLDLNLLVTLSVLLEERSVPAAGRRLGRTPSAMSHALGRLREMLGDPLFVRVGHRLQPTPVAESLSAPLHDTLSAVEALLRQGPFEPARSDRTFRVVASDYLQDYLDEFTFRFGVVSTYNVNFGFTGSLLVDFNVTTLPGYPAAFEISDVGYVYMDVANQDFLGGSSGGADVPDTDAIVGAASALGLLESLDGTRRSERRFAIARGL